jgi:hypothetical protein
MAAWDLKMRLGLCPCMRREAVSSVAVTLLACIALALGIWTLLGLYDPGLTSSGGSGTLSARILVFLALGLFAAATAIWSRLRRKKDEEL